MSLKPRCKSSFQDVVDVNFVPFHFAVKHDVRLHECEESGHVGSGAGPRRRLDRTRGVG